MSEYFFYLGKGRVSDRKASEVDRIARRHGAWFVTCSLPGEGPRYWFACRNRGFPFDERTQAAVMADLAAAKVVLP